MIDRVVAVRQPMLYISTRTSERASSIASTIKTSLDQVWRFMGGNGIVPAGRPLAIFEDWNGRLVTVEAGYPVGEHSLALAAGRIQAGHTPHGPAARTSVRSSIADAARQHEDFADRLHAAGLRTTGTTWEVYAEGGADGARRTELYALLIAPPA